MEKPQKENARDTDPYPCTQPFIKRVSGPEVIKVYSCSIQLSLKQLLIKCKMMKNKDVSSKTLIIMLYLSR